MSFNNDYKSAFINIVIVIAMIIKYMSIIFGA